MEPFQTQITGGTILRELGPLGSVKLLASRILSLNHYFILKMNLNEVQNRPFQVRHPMEMVPIRESDITQILASLDGCTPAERRDVLAFLVFYQNGFKNCFVMRRAEKVAYIQTVIYPSENDLIARRYSTKFLPLQETQVMVENVFTFPPYRGLGCFQSGTWQLLELARANGYRSALSYVRKDRIQALTELVRMGFKIVRIVPEYKMFGAVWRGL